MVKASAEIRKYLGYCLFPQAGVAIGLVLYVQTSPILNGSGVSPVVKDLLALTMNVVLLSVFVNELVGPSITKFGVTKGAELD
jgi:hypothetical protein